MKFVVHMVHIEHVQLNGMHMPLLDVDMANKNAQSVVNVASSSGPTFSMLHTESIEKLGGPSLIPRPIPSFSMYAEMREGLVCKVM